jgi:PST family polysaccharide transporter
MARVNEIGRQSWLAMKDLKEKTIRGGLARILAQGANFSIRLVSLVILARLLDPKDFGMVGMVTAFTGVLTLFRDFGLSAAAIHRPNITKEQFSTLFWINLFVGFLLSVIALVMSPAIAAFYHEPRLVKVTAVLGLAFVFNAAGLQHGVMLQREMRFTALAVITTVSLLIGTVFAIFGAEFGYGYWALVVMAVTFPATTTIGFWAATRWLPGMPHRSVGMRSMMRFGGTITLNSIILYSANNLDKVLLGRFFGEEALGLYGRAFQLVSIPTDNLNSAAGEVAFAALSRLQDDPGRFRNYFLKGYSLVLALTVPITMCCALFASDMIRTLLGLKWMAAVPIFRYLAPTILAFAIVNPLGWMMQSLGLVGRSLKLSFVFAPLMIAGYAAGLSHGPKGVAIGYSAAMLLWIFPAIIWAVRGTPISVRDMLSTVSRPLGSSIVAGALASGIALFFGQAMSPLPRLFLESAVLLVSYLGMLLFVAGEKTFYLELLRGLTAPSSAKKKRLASA